jgi:hypothetical protein
LLPDWQQEFLKTGINEYSSTWEQIMSKAEALEQAETALAKMTSTKVNTREHEDGEVEPTKPPAKKKKKSTFCKMHDPDQNHNTKDCKVINAKIEKLKGRNKSTFGDNNNNNNNNNPNNQQSAAKTTTN